MNLFIFLSLSFQCFVGQMSTSSKVEIKKPFKIFQYKKGESEKNLSKFLKEVWDGGDLDVRILALSWIESRLRVRVRRGDGGRACGIFQIHARYSYPMFHRKKGFVGWKESEQTEKIGEECSKLENVKYSVRTVKKLLKSMDKKKLHPCHHNSGFYGKCNTWYKERLEYWILYFSLSKVLCDERILAMMRTGNPVPSVAIDKVQGYLDYMQKKEPQSDSKLYLEGYNLAESVKEGKEEAPLWAPV